MAHHLKNLGRKVSFSSDMFKAPACLRARGEPQVSRLCPGILSVIIGGVFIAVLITKFIQLIQYDEIKSSLVYSVQQNMTAPSFKNISISISPSWESFNDWSSKFVLNARLKKHTATDGSSVTQLQLQQCRSEQWTDFSNTFKKFVMSQNICIKNPEKVQLQGTNFYLDIVYLQIDIARCTTDNTNHPNKICVNDSVFDAGLEHLYKNESNFFSIYMKDTSINSKKINPLQQYIPLNFNYRYNSISRKNLLIYLGTYEVQTDTSIWPIVTNMETVKGYYITEVGGTLVRKSIEMQSSGKDLYGRITLALSTNQIKFTRRVGKIDDVIAYAGGLFGLILSFFAFFVFSYNKFCYELLVAETSFNYDESGEKVRFKNFSFFRYIKFQAYDWLKMTFNKVPDWQDCKMIYETKDEANLYLDVEYLFRKMRLIDLGVHRLLDGSVQKMLYLTEYPQMSEMAQRRTSLQYYNEIIQSELAMNIQDLRADGFRTNQIVTKVSESMNLIINESNPLPLMSPAQLKKQEPDQTTYLKKQFRQNLKIQDDLVLDAMASFKDLYNEAKEIELEEEHEEAEINFVKAYLHASPSVRQELVNKIPLKILFRFSDRINKMNDQQKSKQTNKSKDRLKQIVKENQKQKTDEKKD